MPKRSARIAIAVIAVLLLGSLVLHHLRGSGDQKADAAETPVALVAPVQRGSIAHVLTLAGQFQPYQVVDVHAKVSGYVKKIFVDIGDKVTAGQTLAILEVPELDAQLKGSISEVQRSKEEIQRATNEVRRAESEHAALHSDYMRLKQAAATQPGLIAEQELDDAEAKDLAAEARVDADKSALSAARQQHDVDDANRERVSDLNDYTHVTAPLTGIITWRYADTGALIQAGTTSDVQSLPLVKLSQSDLLRLRVPVPEDAVQFIHEGQPMQVRVDAVNRSFSGSVVRFTRNVSLATRTMETEIDVPNKDLSLVPGMYANTQLELQHRDNVLTVPAQAVYLQEDKKMVMVVDDQNRVQARSVETGIEGANLVEITGGLKEGEHVIVGGQSKYSPGELVIPKVQHPDAIDVTQETSGETPSQGGKQ